MLPSQNPGLPEVGNCDVKAMTAVAEAAQVEAKSTVRLCSYAMFAVTAAAEAVQL